MIFKDAFRTIFLKFFNAFLPKTFAYQAITESLYRQILQQPKYQDPRALLHFGQKYFSQNEEDGIIAEIFRRIGVKNHSFIEIGVGDGRECNTLTLLYQNWKGLWIEGVASEKIKLCAEKFRNQLQLENVFIDKNNINSYIQKHFSGEIDLLSLDIDSKDAFVLQAINVINPRVIIVEYNARFGPQIDWSVDDAVENFGDDHFGASLKCFENILQNKGSQGYALVACNVTGVNAFFVRKDLLGDHFVGPFTSERWYEPFRMPLSQYFIFQQHKVTLGPSCSSSKIIGGAKGIAAPSASA
ncbi:MAG TPA: hypothetical protein VFO10_14790 [Oligoflexus sp.]|uniref:hypothetical protein n=1 Tax=Oligoflexus sp. TaxID=1971216 RepID=UPI002D803D9B|nr:hypothetical protein [Oligoflexus sp.]HET9238525.1 hypothetical protein [Oligoflexus sp.]